MRVVLQRKCSLTLSLLRSPSNSPYYLPYNSCNVSLENLVLGWLKLPWSLFFFILITCLLDSALKLWREILSWSLTGVKGFIQNFLHVIIVFLQITPLPSRSNTTPLKELSINTVNNQKDQLPSVLSQSNLLKKGKGLSRLYFRATIESVTGTESYIPYQNFSNSCLGWKQNSF